MSVSSTIDICITNLSNDYCDIIKVLRLGGWNPFFDNQIVYLPLGDNDDFNWKGVPISDELKVQLELEQKCEACELLGIVLVWKDSQCGGEFHIFPDGKISINLSVNRRRISQSIRSTDVTWYVDKMMTSFETSSFQVEAISWQEHY